MANVNYDTLTIKINADSKNANQNLNKLIKNLNNLNKTANELNTRRVGEVRNLLLHIAKIDFTNVSKGLKDVVEAFRYFNNKTAQKQSPVFSVYDTKTNNLDKQITSYVKGVGKLNFEFDKLGNKGANAVNKVAKETKKATKETKKQQEETKKHTNQLGKMFKNILKYRVIRKLIQSIFSEMSKAFQDLALTDPSFNEAMTTLVSSLSYIARSLVSVIAPVIKALAPFMEIIAEAINEITTSLAGDLAGALGQEEFAQATERVDDYAESIKKAKSVSMGIDELNVISQDSQSGFTMSEAKSVSGELGDLIKYLMAKLKEALKDLMPQIKKILKSLVELLIKCVPLLVEIIDLVIEALMLTDDGVNESVRATIDMIGDIIYYIGGVVKALKPVLMVLDYCFSMMLNFTNWAISFSALIVSTFTTASKIFKAFWSFDVKTMVSTFTQAFKDIADKWGDFAKGFHNVFAKVINNISQFAENLINKFIDGVNQIGKYTGGWSIPKVNFSGAMLPIYAMGGFPENGLFFANSNELVGRFDNGKTAVANNEQIISGIKQGVKEALLETNGGGNVKVYIDGVEVANIIEKRSKNRGQTLVYGGGINYGK